MDEIEIFEESGEFLEHHGVKGQAWGIQNGPPYPLNGSGKSALAKVKSLLSKTTRSARVERKETAKAFNNRILKAKTTNSQEKIKYLRSKADEATAKKKLKSAKSTEKKTKAEKLREQAEEQKARNQLEGARHAGKKTKAEKILEKAAEQEAKNTLKEYQNTYKQLTAKPKVEKMSAKDKLKQKIIQSGDEKMLKKYGSMLDNDEYRQATARIKQVEDFKGRKAAKWEERGRKAAEGVQKLKQTTDNLASVYNTVASAHNIVVRDSTKQWKQISSNPKTKSAQEQLAEYKAKRELTQRKAAEDGYNTYLNQILSTPIGNGTGQISREERDKLLNAYFKSQYGKGK